MRPLLRRRAADRLTVEVALGARPLAATVAADLASRDADIAARALAADVTAGFVARPVFAFARTIADANSIVTALADIPGLLIALAADTDYSVELVLFYQSAAVGTGLSLSMNGPAVAVGRKAMWESAIQTAGGPSTTALNIKAQVAADALHTTASVDAANAPRIARFFGCWPVGGVRGNLTARFASEVANSQVRILRGSWLRAY